MSLHTSHVVVIGGGASGALAAAHLLREGDATLRVTLVEPDARLGRGLAYATRSPSHLLNARACKMSGFDDRPEDFSHWLASREGGSGHAPGDCYAERRLFGRYLGEMLRPWLAHGGDGRLSHLRGEAVDLVEDGFGVRCTLADGTVAIAQSAVLALGHGLRAGEVAEPPCDPRARVLILGSGLGMVDAVLGLLDAGHRGEIVALSRRGQVPRPHGTRQTARLDPADVPFGEDLSEIMRWLRGQVGASERRGCTWGDLVDAMRPHVPQIWAELPPDARRRFLRHARPWWDVHRHRMAPAVATRIAAARDEGKLTVRAGRVVDQKRAGGGVDIVWRARGQRATCTERFAAIIDCTGPRGGSIGDDRLLGRLFASGTARLDPLRIGIDVTGSLAVVAGSGLPSSRIYATGPLTCPLAWETYAIPEIRAQCAIIAAEVLSVFRNGTGLRLTGTGGL